MAVDMFLELKDVEGETVDATFKGKKAMDVLAWSWGVSQSGTTHMGGGGGSGKSSFQDVSVTKYIDTGSPNLWLYCANGKHIPEGKLTIRKAGEKPLEYLVIKFTDLIITSVSTGGSGGEDRLTENVTLNFAKVELEYTSQKKDGSKDKTIPFKWNIEENVKM